MAKKPTKPVTKPKPESSEKLALRLNQCYVQLMQVQQQIQAINKELERRELANRENEE
jgi:hypothetical protein